MLEFGVGKNMVRAMRFWVEAAGLAVTAEVGMKPTPLGEKFFGADGLDPYLARLSGFVSTFRHDSPLRK